MGASAGAPAIVVVVGDLHINSTVALIPPSVQLDDGGTHRQSRAQRWIYRCWQDFWQKVEALPRSALYVVVNGDTVEGVHHATTQLVSTNLKDQFRMATELLEPVARASDALFMVRGTESHTGPASMWEELLAKDLGAVECKAGRTWSWWHLPLSVEGVKLDIAHHPQTHSRRPWTQDSAAARQASITAVEYWENDERPPDAVVRGHVHQWAKGTHKDTWGFFHPAWQLTTAYGTRLGAGRHIEPIGGLVFQCQNGRLSWPDKWPAIRYSPRRTPWTSPKPS